MYIEGTGWQNDLRVRPPFLYPVIRTHGFGPWSIQTDDLNIDSCHFLASTWHYYDKARTGWFSVSQL